MTHSLARALWVNSDRAHVALSVGLALRRPRWRAPLAFVVPPLAPWWGARERMRARSLLWVGSLAIYLTALVAGL